MRNVFLVLSALLLFVSCQKEKSAGESYETIVVDLEQRKTVQEEAAFSDFSPLLLEVTDESMLGYIAKVVCSGDRLYVLSMMEPTVFIFDKSGKFRSKLAKGQGPGEVIFVSDATVYNDTLFVLDNYRSIKAYDLDGHFLGEKMKIEGPYFSIHFTPEGLYLLDPNINRRSEHNLHVLTNTGKEELYLPKNKWLQEVSIASYYAMRDRYIVWPLSDKVYRIEEKTGRVYPVYWIDFKGKWIEAQEFKESVKNDDMNHYVRWLKDVMDMPDGGLFFGFKYDRDYYVKYRDGECRLYAHLLKDCPNPEMNAAAVGAYQGSLIYVYAPEALQKYKEEHPQSKLATFEWLNQSAENLNPILFFVPVGDK